MVAIHNRNNLATNDMHVRSMIIIIITAIVVKWFQMTTRFHASWVISSLVIPLMISSHQTIRERSCHEFFCPHPVLVQLDQRVLPVLVLGQKSAACVFVLPILVWPGLAIAVTSYPRAIHMWAHALDSYIEHWESLWCHLKNSSLPLLLL